MRKRLYHKFPYEDIEFEQKYRYHADLQYLVKVMANINGKFGMFVTESVVQKGHKIEAKREIGVEIVVNGVDFEPLNNRNLDTLISTIESKGIIDFKINLNYSYLDKNYNRVPFRGDTYLVRASLENDVLILQIHRIDGVGRTETSRLADTIIEEIRRDS